MRPIASRHASVGDLPCRIISIIVCPPEILMFSSPFPVEPAAPTSLSTQHPAPMIGESPTRPGIFHDSPEVVVVAEMSPFASTAMHGIVPVRGCAMTRSAYAISFSSPSKIAEMCSFHSGESIPGRQLNDDFAFQASQIFRECSVSRFISSNPSATANRRAPSPTIITWLVFSITVFARRETFLIRSTLATEPARCVGPCMALEIMSGRLPCAGLRGNAGAVAAAPFESDNVRPKSLPAPATALPISEVRKNLRRDHSSIEEPPQYAEGTIQQLIVDS